MRRRTRRSLLCLAALACLLALAAVSTGAPPEDADWASITVEGAPTGAGFLGDGSLVYATTDAGTTGSTDADCSTEGGDADLFLVSFPGGPGCLQALDASEGTTSEGVAALATARRGDAALVALPHDGSSGLGLGGANLLLFEKEGDNLTQAWSDDVPGLVTHVALDPEGQRAAIVHETDSGNHRLVTYAGGGDQQDTFQLPGPARDLAISENARYVAVGGNFSQSGSSVGWVHLYDLAPSDEDNPVIDRTIPRPRAGIVTSVTLTDEPDVFAGLLDGTARWVRQGGDDQEASVGTDPVHIDVHADGTGLFAASGNESAGLEVQDGDLQARWHTRVNGTSQAAITRLPHHFAIAETVNAFAPGGQRLWETTAGSVAAVNDTGLGIVLASDTSGSGPGGASSVLEGRVLQRNLTLDQAEPMTVAPGGVARTNVTLENTGAAVLNLTPTASEDGLRVRASPSTMELLPGQREPIAITVEADRSASPGDRSIALDLQAHPQLDTDPRLDVEVTAMPNVTVELAGGEVADRDVTQGQAVNVRLDLRNRGNAEAHVTLEALQSVDSAWPASVSPNETITVPAGSLTTARVEITVPATTPNGTENRIILRGDSAQGASALQVNLTVNPFQVLRIRPDTITQDLAPGDTGLYDLSVENLGSVGADTDLRLQPLDPDGEPCVPTAWGLALETSSLEVPAQGTNPVRVEITAPAELPVPEVQNGTAGCTDDAQRPSLRVELHGRSDAGSQDSSLLFANVDPSLAEEPERNDEPFPGVLALLVVFTVSATLKRGANP